MKRIIVFITILTIFVVLLPASENISVSGEKGLSIGDLNWIQNVFTNEPQTGAFKQTKTISTSSRKLISTGTVNIVPGYGVIWYTSKPYKSMLVIGKEYMIQKIRESEPKKLEASSNPIYLAIAQCMDSLFSGDFNSLQELFEVSYSIDNNGWSIMLIPNNSTIGSFMSEIIMTGSSKIGSLMIKEKTGDSILYEFSDLHVRNFSNEEMSVFNI